VECEKKGGGGGGGGGKTYVGGWGAKNSENFSGKIAAPLPGPLNCEPAVNTRS